MIQKIINTSCCIKIYCQSITNHKICYSPSVIPQASAPSSGRWDNTVTSAGSSRCAQSSTAAADAQVFRVSRRRSTSAADGSQGKHRLCGSLSTSKKLLDKIKLSWVNYLMNKYPLIFKHIYINMISIYSRQSGLHWGDIYFIIDIFLLYRLLKSIYKNIFEVVKIEVNRFFFSDSVCSLCW